MVGNGQMKYAQSTKLEIYDKPFNHTDENELTRQWPATGEMPIGDYSYQTSLIGFS